MIVIIIKKKTTMQLHIFVKNTSGYIKCSLLESAPWHI